MTKVAVGPAGFEWFAPQLVDEVGDERVEPEEAEVLLWMHWADGDGLVATLARMPHVRWVQLPWAGVEAFTASLQARPELTWTCGKGAYAPEVAEHALALALACARRLPDAARATAWGDRRVGLSLLGRHLVVLGAGGITEQLLRLVEPLRMTSTVVRRSAEPVAGAGEVVTVDRLHEVLPTADLLVLALALTPETTGIIGAPELALLPPDAILVNVARGPHVDTDALVDALREGRLFGAGVDVTDPEPLPADHPLFSLPGAIVTPHRANTPDMGLAPLRERIAGNLRAWREGRPLTGLVDPARGY